MTTTQDRIINSFDKKYPRCGCVDCCYIDDITDRFEKEPTRTEIKQFLIQSIKEVEKETRKEIIKNINTHKTLVAVADGNKYFEVMSIGNIIVKPIKNIGNGARYKQVIYDESISITNKEKEK